MFDRLFAVIRFILFIVFLPLLVAMTTAFLGQIRGLDAAGQNFFIWGVIAYILTHLFVADLNAIYQFGKKLMGDIFKFFEPLVAVAPLVLPIYTILSIIAAYFCRLFLKGVDLSGYFLFLIAFSFTMHLIFTASDLRNEGEGMLRANYFFSMTLVYMINLVLIVFLFNLTMENFSFVGFFAETSRISQVFYKALTRQLFVP